MEKAVPYAVRSTVRPKRVARLLRAALAARGIDRPHVACLGLVARMYGHPDFATLERLAPRQEASLDDDLVDAAEVAARRDAQVSALVASGIGRDVALAVVDEIRPSGRAVTAPVAKGRPALLPAAVPPGSGTTEGPSRDGRPPWRTAYDTSANVDDVVPEGEDRETGPRVAIRMRGEGSGALFGKWLGEFRSGIPAGEPGRDDPATALGDFSTLLGSAVGRAEEAVLEAYVELVEAGDAGDDEDLVQTAAAEALRTGLEGSMLVISSNRLHDIHNHLQEHLDGRLARLERETEAARKLIPELRHAAGLENVGGWRDIVVAVLAAGLSYSDIVGRSGCSKSTVARWASGHSSPARFARAALCGRFADMLEDHADRADFLLEHLGERDGDPFGMAPA